MHKKVFFEYIIYLISKLKREKRLEDYYAGSNKLFFYEVVHKKIIYPPNKKVFLKRHSVAFGGLIQWIKNSDL